MFKIFGKHYGTERFFVLLFAMFFAIVALFGYSASIQHDLNKFRVGSTALYTYGYTWSRTSSGGSVKNLVSNKSGTAVFLLIKNDDPSMTSTNADDYQVFMTGLDEPLSNSPAMTVYSFGLTGYVGFYFTDAKGFANQRYSLILRADSAGSQMADESMFDTSVRDESFRDHNQVRLIMNFGASGIDRLPVMDEPGLTPMKLMCDLNIDLNGFGLTEDGGNFDILKSTAESTLEQMNTSLVSIAQYRATLDENGVIVPDLPYYLAGDAVNFVPNDFTREPSVFEIDMVSGGSSGSGTSFVGNGSGQSTGNTSQAGDPTGNSGTGATWTDYEGKVHQYMYLHTDYLYPGTAHVQWQGAKLSDGLITQTRFYQGGAQSLDEAYGSYSSWCKACKADYDSSMPSYVRYDSWRMKDGSYVDMVNAKGLDKQIVDMINRYVTEVNNYAVLKAQYLKSVNSMLQSEAAIQALRTMIYSNNGSSARNLWLY